MNLTSEQAIKSLLKRHNIRPSKRLGQNFLIDKDILNKIIQASQLTKQDNILEIGPGIGALTQELAQRAKKVIAVEKDKELAEILKNNISQYQNVEILQGDILKFSISNFQFSINFQFLIFKNYKIIANLPYNIALAVIRKFVEAKHPPQAMILMLQKEVAQKICAKKSSLPKIAIEFYSKARILFYVPKESFWPMPKVDGAVIEITDIQKNIPKVDKDLFFKILKLGFSHPRKTILNNLSKGLDIEKQKINSWLKKSEINPNKRPEELNLKNWIKTVSGFNF